MYAKGIVDVVSIKVRKGKTSGKEFGSASIKIGEQWFNTFAKHADSGYVLVDKNKNEVTKGMEIELMYEPNKEGFNDIEKGTLKILASGSAAPPQQTPPPPEQSRQVSLPNVAIWIESNRLATVVCRTVTHGEKKYDYKDVVSLTELISEKAKSHEDSAVWLRCMDNAVIWADGMDWNDEPDHHVQEAFNKLSRTADYIYKKAL